MIFLLTTLIHANETVLFEAGSFERGSGVAPDESPRHTVHLDSFLLDRSEVSIAEFEEFVQNGWSEDGSWSEEGLAWRHKHPQGAGKENRAAGRKGNHPVVAVSWYEADAYCRWKGGGLPTESQWERAACPEEGRFAWGDSEEVEAAWYSGGKYGHLQSVLTKEVDQAPTAQQSQDGLYHSTGNVWEWTADWYHARYYQDKTPANPAGPETGHWKTLRGGSFMNLPSYCSCTHREPARPERVAFTVGFRCAYPGAKQ